MKPLSWSRSTSPAGAKPEIVSEFLLNELGIFVKREKRMPKKAGLTALTGFRVGYTAVPGSDYRVAPMDRSAILWYKITRIVEAGPEGLIVSGNQKDTITLCFDPADRGAIQAYIDAMRQQHPAIGAPDYDAAAWLCWRDDDDWGDDPNLSLVEMVALEGETERFIEPEIFEETRLPGVRDHAVPEAPVPQRSAFCPQCGTALGPDHHFCPECGRRIES
ncbi:zinc ribbon domain-containing protein [Acetobacterium wieringae]|uniref:Zinc ribbon domain-containing protein n=1 Tax=Acetobacterium wieringae TaxID=52694 RepID=A0ABY6HKC4_9FIRM|nr:zinc ribbon domain-containing protein [Acetobacterium wieringae]MEA4807623.1 zinc ribbon domain-containing protein [Acetobacterium wieringae]UYO64003.1 zinc ribbon domain-containing protein [Acetobacterium wieringae]VUZ27869.1 Uncharacterised protein [Acetobacterium wieringae]